MLTAALDERARAEGVGNRLAQSLGPVDHKQLMNGGNMGGRPICSASTIAFTANTYLHPLHSTMLDMADKMDAIIGK